MQTWDQSSRKSVGVGERGLLGNSKPEWKQRNNRCHTRNIGKTSLPENSGNLEVDMNYGTGGIGDSMQDESGDATLENMTTATVTAVATVTATATVTTTATATVTMSSGAWAEGGAARTAAAVAPATVTTAAKVRTSASFITATTPASKGTSGSISRAVDEDAAVAVAAPVALAALAAAAPAAAPFTAGASSCTSAILAMGETGQNWELGQDEYRSEGDEDGAAQAEALRWELLEVSMKCGALCFGEFVLKSGRLSPYFFDAGKFGDGKALLALAGTFAAEIHRHRAMLRFDVLLGLAYKGIPIASAVAILLKLRYGRDCPFLYTRKEPKSHGEQGDLVGAIHVLQRRGETSNTVPLSGDMISDEPIDGLQCSTEDHRLPISADATIQCSQRCSRVLIIDDTLTAGTAVADALQLLGKYDCSIAGLVVCLDREEHVKSNSKLVMQLNKMKAERNNFISSGQSVCSRYAFHTSSNTLPDNGSCEVTNGSSDCWVHNRNIKMPNNGKDNSNNVCRRSETMNIQNNDNYSLRNNFCAKCEYRSNFNYRIKRCNEADSARAANFNNACVQHYAVPCYHLDTQHRSRNCEHKNCNFYYCNQGYEHRDIDWSISRCSCHRHSNCSYPITCLHHRACHCIHCQHHCLDCVCTQWNQCNCSNTCDHRNFNVHPYNETYSNHSRIEYDTGNADNVTSSKNRRNDGHINNDDKNINDSNSNNFDSFDYTNENYEASVGMSTAELIQEHFGFPVISLIKVSHVVHYLHCLVDQGQTEYAQHLEDIKKYRNIYGIYPL